MESDRIAPARARMWGAYAQRTSRRRRLEGSGAKARCRSGPTRRDFHWWPTAVVRVVQRLGAVSILAYDATVRNAQSTILVYREHVRGAL